MDFLPPLRLTSIFGFLFEIKLFAVLFFLMLITLAIGSAAGLTSCVITILCDDFPSVKRWIITAVVSVVSFFIGLIYVTPVSIKFVFLLSDFLIVMINDRQVLTSWISWITSEGVSSFTVKYCTDKFCL